MVAAVSSDGVDTQLGEGGGQVSGAAAPAQSRGCWVTGLVLVQRRGQRRREVEAGQVGQRAAGVGDLRDALDWRGRLLRGREDARTS